MLIDLARRERAVGEEASAYARHHGVGAVLSVNQYLTGCPALACAEPSVS